MKLETPARSLSSLSGANTALLILLVALVSASAATLVPILYRQSSLYARRYDQQAELDVANYKGAASQGM